jgi:uncharacterized protein (PEP-CTERM system associated)
MGIGVIIGHSEVNWEVFGTNRDRRRMINWKSTWVHVPLSMAFLSQGLGYTLTAQANDWILAPGVTMEQVYTDNVNLDEEGRSESITRISPWISAYREGARARLDLRYAPQYRHYWQETESNQVVNFLRADGQVELYENHLFVDGWATADQRTTNSAGRTGIDSLSGSGDLTEVYSGGISPYYITRLGPYLAAEARYRLDRVYYAEDGLDGNTGQRVHLMLGNSPSYRALLWKLHLEERQVNYDALEDDDRIRRARSEVNYQLSRTWALTGTLGYEKYELAVSNDQQGNLWNVGFIYTPTPRTRLAAGVGERFFGTDYYMDFSHRTKRLVWTASYSQDVASARNEVLDSDLFARQDEFGNLIRDPVSSSAPTDVRSGATLNEEYYLLDKFNVSVSLAMERTRLTLSAAYIKREYDQDALNEDTEDHNLVANLNRTIRQRLSGYLRLSWNDHQQESSDYQQWIARAGGSYRLGERSSLNLSLAHLDRDASVDIDSYTENRISLALQANW